MTDTRVEKQAELILNYSVQVQPGDLVWIDSWQPAEPLLRALYRQTLQLGALPVLEAKLPDYQELYFNYVSDQILSQPSPVHKLLYETCDVRLKIYAESNTKELNSVDPARVSKWYDTYRDLTQGYLERSARGETRWNVTMHPTPAYAQDTDMGFNEFSDFVYQAMRLNDPDPVASWQAVAQKQQAIVDWLSQRKTIRLVAPGTDLTLSIAGRTWINSDGTKNLPDGEIFTGPVETSANGQVQFSFPAVHKGREVEDVRLWFEAGRVVKAAAGKNQAYLEQMLDTDPGARYLGEFAIGTNYHIQHWTRNILFDEKLGGTVHMALGQGYPETGNHNVSGIHWDMICDLRPGGEIYADGELFFKDGKFTRWELGAARPGSAARAGGG
jgi:aminopeptidase